MKVLQSNLGERGVTSHLVYGLHPLIEALKRRDIDFGPLLSGAGIAEETLKSPEYRLTPSQELSFTEGAIRAIDEPELGLEVGAHYHMASYGMLGLAAMASSSLLQGLELYARHYLMCWTYFNFSLEVESGEVAIIAEGHRDLGYCRRYMSERDLSASYLSVKEILGRDVPLLGVSFMHDAGAPAECYEAVFGCEVEFGAERLAYRFDESYLQERPLQCAPETFQVYDKQCTRICAELAKNPSMSELCRQFLLEAPGRVASLESLAAHLHASPRSIQRKLAGEGTSYKELLEDVRKNLALEYLQDRALPISEIAQRLGYSEAPNFINAYKRWTGMTPGEFRLSQH